MSAARVRKFCARCGARRPCATHSEIRKGDAPTPRQRELFAAMLSTQVERGVPMSVREMADFLGVVSTNAVSELLRGLELRGLVKRIGPAKSSRGWIVVRDAAGAPSKGKKP